MKKIIITLLMIIFTMGFLFFVSTCGNEKIKTPELLAQEQLDAYNNRDIDAFLDVYSDDVKIYDLSSGKVISNGKEEMRKTYGKMFTELTELNAKVTNRMVLNKFAIDYEDVTFTKEKKTNAIAIYETKDNKIHKVWFIK